MSKKRMRDKIPAVGEAFIEGTNKAYIVSKSGNVWSQFQDRYIGQQVPATGYKRVYIVYPGGCKSMQVHRLVMLAFKPHKDHRRLTVNHINGIKSDNSLENLEWCTSRANLQHAWATGLMCRGEYAGRAKLKEEEVLEIRAWMEHYQETKSHHNFTGSPEFTATALAKLYGVTAPVVFNIAKRRTWKHI